MASAATGWQAMGKPDFATCGRLFYRLPADLREGMNRSEEKVLIWTLFLSWTSAYRSGRGTAYASFSETWLGRSFARSRWTVARALSRLEDLTLLKRIRRHPKKDGTFQTNLIALTARLSAFLPSTRRQVVDKSPCSKSAPQEVGNGNKQERTATFRQSASPSLSPSISDYGREKDTDGGGEEKRMEKGTLMRLFLAERNKKAG